MAHVKTAHLGLNRPGTLTDKINSQFMFIDNNVIIDGWAEATDGRLDDIESRLNLIDGDAPPITVSLSNISPVASFVASIASPINLSFTAPDIAINLFGNTGDCEALTSYNGVAPVISTTQKKFGSASTKFVPTASSVSYGFRDFINFSIDPAKSYIMSAWVYIESYTSGTGLEIGLSDVGAFNTRYRATPDTSKVGSWQHVGVIVPAGSAYVGTGVRLVFGSTSTGVLAAYIDGIMLKEIPPEDGGLTLQQLLDKHPYVSSIKPLMNPVLKVSNGNLVYNGSCENGVSGWLLANGSGSASFGVVNSKFSIAISNNNADYAYQFISVKKNTNYYIRYNGSNNANIRIFGLDSVATPLSLAGYGHDGVGSFNTGNYGIICVLLGTTVSGVGTFTFDSISITEGNADPGVYTAHGETSIILNGKFYKIPGTIYADIVKVTNKSARRLRAVKEVDLNGGLPWTYGNSFASYKQLQINSFPSDIVGSSTSLAVKIQKYDGTIINSGSGVGYFAISAALSLYVSSSETGFSDGFIPSQAEIQAFFNGWKINNGTFGVLYASGTKTWIPWNATDNSNAVTTCPTGKAPGWDKYATMFYALATPIEEPIDVVGDLGAFEGLNTISLDTGLVYEKVKGIGTDSTTAYINTSAWSSTWLSYKADRILGVYRNGVLDGRWFLNNTSAYGNSRALALISDYDPTAEYHVLYQVTPGDYSSQRISAVVSIEQDIANISGAIASSVAELEKFVSLIKYGYVHFGNDRYQRNMVIQPQFRDYTERVTTYSLGAGVATLDFTLSNMFECTLGGAVTFMFTNPAPSGQLQSITLRLKQGGTAYAITFPSNVKWKDNVIPDMSTINYIYDVILSSTDGGSSWQAGLAAKYPM